MSQRESLTDKGLKGISSGLDALKSESGKLTIVGMVFIFILLFSVIFYTNYQRAKDTRNCNKLNSNYNPNIPNGLLSIRNGSTLNDVRCKTVAFPEGMTFCLNDYYVKSSYNSCSSGELVNDYVNLCALDSVLRQGYRFIDFEIYSKDDNPVIATSSKSVYNVKETWNSVDFGDALSLIMNKGFTSTIVSNYDDPLFINLRVKSSKKETFDKMASDIYNICNSRLCDVKYGFEFYVKGESKNIFREPITNFTGKIIFLIDGITNQVYKESQIYEFINASTSGSQYKIIRYDEIRYSSDLMGYISKNYDGFMFVIPSLSNKLENMDINLINKNGIQAAGQSIQKMDDYLANYNNFFKNQRHAFVLKEEGQRMVPMDVPNPPLPNKKLSLAPRENCVSHFKGMTNCFPT